MNTMACKLFLCFDSFDITMALLLKMVLRVIFQIQRTHCTKRASYKLIISSVDATGPLKVFTFLTLQTKKAFEILLHIKYLKSKKLHQISENFQLDMVSTKVYII